MLTGIARSDPTTRPDGPSHEPHDRAIARVDRRRVILLHQIRSQRSAEHDPGAAAHVADVDDGECGENADRDTTEKRGLQLGRIHWGPLRWSVSSCQLPVQRSDIEHLEHLELTTGN